MADGLSLSGEYFARSMPGYEDARLDSVWTKLKPDRYPDFIVRARDIQDVREVVRFANRSRTGVAVKGSGHNFVGSFLRDGGILLDLSHMNTMEMAGHSALVGPGVRSRDLAAFLAKNERAFPAGHNGNVGLAGYLLGGGMGWNGESWGQMACHNIEAVDVVTASGDLITVDGASHPELLWAARGAGPFFPGIVTRFQLATYDYPAGMQTAIYSFPRDMAAGVAQWLSDAAYSGPADLEYFLVIEAPGDIGRWRCTAYVTSFDTDAARGRAALKRVVDAAPDGALEKTEFLTVSFEALYADSITGPVRRIANDTIWTDDGVAATVALAMHSLEAPSAATVSVINFRRPPKPMADCAAQAWASAFLTWGAQWDESEGDAANLLWVAQAAELLEPFRVGCYVNETDYFRRPGRLSYCYSTDAIRRIRRLQNDFDPDGRFRPLVQLPVVA